MPVSEKLRRELRGRGHTLKPVVTIGNAGLSPAVMREIDLSLEHHELMKVKITGSDREQRAAIVQSICEKLGAEQIQSIGHIALVYRPSDG